MSIITTRSLINSVFKKKELNIITFYHDGVFETELSSFGHRLHYIKKNANKLISLPNLFPLALNNFTNTYDLILCSECLNNYDDAISLSNQLHIPVLFYEQHNAPAKMPPDKLFLNKQKYRGQNIVFPNKEIANSWRFSEKECFIADYDVSIRPHFAMKDKIKIWTNYSNPNDINILNVFLQNLPEAIKVDCSDNLRVVFDDAKFYISLVASQETPLDILCAMATGAVVLTNKSAATDRIIKHGENGFILKDVHEFKNIIRNLRQYEIEQISHNAIETIINRQMTFYNLNDALIQTSKRVFTK